MAGEDLQTVVSLLPKLEPLFGAAFAVNLAYLNLKTLRYRKLLIDKSRSLLAVEGGGVGLNNPNVRTKWYKQISSLVAQSEDKPPALNLPVRLWSIFYVGFFHNWLPFKGQVDRLGACIATFFSVIYLIFGVANDVGKWQWSMGAFTSAEIGNELYYAIVFLFWPIIMVFLGAVSIFGGTSFIEYQLDGLKDTGKGDARDVDTDLPEPPAT